MIPKPKTLSSLFCSLTMGFSDVQYPLKKKSWQLHKDNWQACSIFGSKNEWIYLNTVQGISKKPTSKDGGGVGAAGGDKKALS